MKHFILWGVALLATLIVGCSKPGPLQTEFWVENQSLEAVDILVDGVSVGPAHSIAVNDNISLRLVRVGMAGTYNVQFVDRWGRVSPIRVVALDEAAYTELTVTDQGPALGAIVAQQPR